MHFLYEGCEPRAGAVIWSFFATCGKCFSTSYVLLFFCEMMVFDLILHVFEQWKSSR